MRSFSIKLFLLLFTIMAIHSCKKDDSPVEEMIDPLAENKKALGESAEEILSDDIYTSLTIELAYSEDYKPTQETIDNFRAFLMARVSKPQGIIFVETVVPEQPNDPFTIEEIREIEDRIRTKYTEGDNIAVYVFFSNGSSTNDTQTTVTLGSAYRNTSIVIYERTIKVITESDPIILPLLETTTLNHEFGHILSLTNILGDDIHQMHEDQAHLKHCFVEECLMYFDAVNVTRARLERLIRRMEVPEFDPLCIADLQAKGGL